MQYLIDIGSSTVKMYERKDGKVSQIAAKTFDFKDNFDPNHGLSSINKEKLYDFFEGISAQFSLTNSNTKIYATGIFRDFVNKQVFLEEFYVRTQLFFNVVSHDLEAFYLEKAWIGRCSCKDSLLVINIGGKTTELIVYKQGVTVERIKLSIGVGTILKNYALINEKYCPVHLSEILDYVRSELPQISSKIDTAIYTGGELTYMQVAGYALQENTIFSDDKHPSMINLEDYSAQNQRVFSEITITELRTMMPDNPDWMNGARACSALAQSICAHFGVETIIPSDSNLIDGVNIQEAKNVVVCGSFNKHLQEISGLIDNLRKRGIIVLSPQNLDVVGSKDGFILFKGDIIENHRTWSVESQHLQAIEKCDIVIACNFNGYIGTKTALEIGYAYKCGKKVVFIENNAIIADFDIPSEIHLL
jgi:hypothetical protein